MSPGVEDEAGGALAQGRTREVITVLMRGYGTQVLRYCRAFLRDVALAEDIRQKVFIQAYRDLEKYSGTSTLCAWLRGIARNRCLDALKERANYEARTARVHTVVRDQDDPLELAQLLTFCLQELDEEKREAVVLRHVLGQPYAEIGATLNATAAALQLRVARALLHLRACVEQHGGRL